MWSRFNAVGMRQRWGTLESDPGRTCRLEGSRRRGGESPGGGSAGERVRRAFLSGEAVVECVTPGCPGLYITARRELVTSPGTGSRVLLRCTRSDEEHDVTLQMKPYDENELERLRASQHRGEAPSCPRCRVELRETEASGSGYPAGASPAIYECEWCGVRWRPNRDAGNRMAG